MTIRRLSAIACLAGFSAASSGCALFGKKAPPAPLNPATAEEVKVHAQKSFEEEYVQEGNKVVAAPHVSTAASAAAAATQVSSETIKVLGKDKYLPCIWVEAPAEVIVDNNTSPAQARAIAVAKAEASAMEAPFIHVNIKQRDMVFQQTGLRDNPTMVETLLSATRPGRIIKEEPISESHRDLEGSAGYYAFSIDTKMCLVPLASDADKNFGVEMWISRQESKDDPAESAKHFVSGDPVKISIACSEDCYIYLYDLYDEVKDGQATHQIARVLPNSRIAPLKEVHLQGGHTWNYPNAELTSDYGVQLSAQLPAGKSESTEAIWVLASKSPLPPDITQPTEDGQRGILQNLFLSRLPLTWADDSQGYVIYGN